MEAVTSSSPPAGAPTLADVVWMRPDVQLLPEPSAVMLRSPLPSRWTLLVEFVMVSISPVPKFDPGPVSYCHCESTPEPPEPLTPSLNWGVPADGGPGTALGAGAGGPRGENLRTEPSVGREDRGGAFAERDCGIIGKEVAEARRGDLGD